MKNANRPMNNAAGPVTLTGVPLATFITSKAKMFKATKIAIAYNQVEAVSTKPGMLEGFLQ